MNLTKLFDAQRVLANRIVEEHPELKGQDNLPWKILAFQVEVGELANEWRGFKMWSHDRKPRTKNGCFVVVDGKVKEQNPLLEEYVDCLHFLLDIGLEMKYEKLVKTINPIKNDNIINQFIFINTKAGTLLTYRALSNYIHILQNLIGLGEMLGFTWEEIEAAYFEKNKINHERQQNKY